MVRLCSHLQLFGNWIKWLVLTFITLGIYGFWLNIKLEQWITKHTHHVNNPNISITVNN